MRPPRDTTARRLPGLLIAAAVVGGCAPGPAAGGGPPPPSSAAPGSTVEVLTDATLPRIALAQFLPGAPGWPDQLAAGAQTTGTGNPSANPASTVDHGIALGGIGSDLYPADAPDEYWMITDRGPNGQIKVEGPNRRTFPVPSFDPLILRVRAQPGAPLNILQVIPLTTTDGHPVTGLPNDAGRDERPYNLTATTELPTNPSGLDPEGMVHSPNGEFWLSEEYSPSILHVSPTGTVLSASCRKG